MHPDQLTFPFRFPRLVQCSHADTCPDSDLHHLTWDRHRGKWEVRLTINVGKKVVGKRIRQKLSTADAHEAMRQRDAIIRAYKKLGLTIVDRRQKRWAKSGNESEGKEKEQDHANDESDDTQPKENREEAVDRFIG